MEERPGRLFQGVELPRLLVLLAILLAGWPYVLWKMAPRQAPAPPPVAVKLPPLPPADDAIEFRGVRDRAPLSARETPAYLKLLARAREAVPAKLASQSRRDVLFSQLLETPERYRALPIHVEGTALRVLHQDVKGSKVFPKGRYFEAYVITPDSQHHPYILVFEDPPPDLLAGDNTWQRVAFDGYFFKLMAYSAGDTPRVAPLLVGKFPPAEPGAVKPGAPIFAIKYEQWPVLLLILLTIYFSIRIALQLRRYRRLSRRPSLLRPSVRPTEEIAPEALANWLQHGAGAEDEDEEYADEDEDDEP